MARKRYQNPTPKRRGNWWYILVRRDEMIDGRVERKNSRVKVAPVLRADGTKFPVREVQKIAHDMLAKINSGTQEIGGAATFDYYLEHHYEAIARATMAKSTWSRYKGVLNNYLKPAFGTMLLRDITPATIDQYFAGLADKDLSQESVDKIRDVLASVLKRAVRHEMLNHNPVEGVELPRATKGKITKKPVITYQQCEQLLAQIPEPYATMVYVAIWTGLRVSELIGLKWEDIRNDSITVDERYCRGDWGAPKSTASNATIGVDSHVISRINRLKSLTVTIRNGGFGARKTFPVVKSSEPTSLVFQSVRTGAPMRDNNILSRYIKPAARKLGLPFVNWKCLRTSRATWLIQAGANPKDVQGLMRHSRISTTMDIYAQQVAESQRLAIAKVTAMVASQRAHQDPLGAVASMRMN